MSEQPQPISVKPTDFEADVDASTSEAVNVALGDKPKKREVTLGERTTRRGSFFQIFSSRAAGGPASRPMRRNSLFEVMTRRRSSTTVNKMPKNPAMAVDLQTARESEGGKGVAPHKAAAAADTGTALAPGGEVDIFELRNIGFILQYFAIGIIYGGLPATIYGLFLGYLSVPGYVYATAGVITTLPWSFKFFFGMLNDCVPIAGYRRKPYMVIGWALCCAMLVFLSTHTLPEPYYCFVNGTYLEEDPPCNPSAKEKGGEYAMLMCLAALGYVVADVGADGLMVQYAQREPQETRGQTQTMIYLVRTLGVVVATALVGLCMNGKEYNGTFDWTLSYNQICAILAVPAGVMVPVSWFLVQEEKVQMGSGGSRGSREGEIIGDEAHGGAPTTFRAYLRQSWDLLSSRAFFFVVLFNFFEPFVGRISTTAGGYVKSEWAGVKSLQNQMFSLVSSLVFAFGLYQVKKRFLNYSWRKMLAVTTIVLNATDMLIAFLTIFDVVRNQYFYLGETILDEIPAAANFVVGTYIIVEMADVGNEGLTYGLLTTISNLGSPFARAVGNQIFGAFKQNLSERQNYVEDTPSFRNAVALSFGMSYAFSFAALGFLVLLPRQKEEAQLRKATWGRSPAYAYTTIALLACALCYSLSVNFLAMFPDTMCLKFAGGSGCDGAGGGNSNSTSV